MSELQSSSIPQSGNFELASERLPVPSAVPTPAGPAPASPQILRDTRTCIPPRTELEQQLSRIWSELLRLEPIGREDDFFDLGGHSLLASQMVAHVRQALQLEATTADLFEAPTLNAFAALLEKRNTTQAAPMPTLKKLARAGSSHF